MSKFTKSYDIYDTRIYRIYRNMLSKDYNPNMKCWDLYSWRFIKVHDEWLGENGFINFYKWAMENGYTDNLILSRIDYNGNYDPSNCRWIEQKISDTDIDDIYHCKTRKCDFITIIKVFLKKILHED